MENSDPNNKNNNSSNHNSKRTLRRNSNSHISMSDTESTTSQVDSWHSPLRYDSPLRSDDPIFQPENTENMPKNSKSLLPVVDKNYSPVPSPGKPNTAAGVKGWRPWPHSERPCSEKSVLDQEKVENRDFTVNRLERGLEEGYVGEERRAVETILKRSERNVGMRKLALGVRVFEVMASLVSFSVMAADRTQGWSGDSFDRYKEYRFCLAVNVVAFVYSGFQALVLACTLGTGKPVIAHNLRYHFEFSIDQILAYLLMSASSSAATRVDDWISNWGKDEFTIMASASIAVSFLTFIAFATSSLISGYNLCNREST